MARAARFSERRKRWVASRADAAAAARAARSSAYNTRKRAERSRLDYAQRARRLLVSKAGPGAQVATVAELRALWEKQGGRCALTGVAIVGTPHLDHILPAAKGGGHLIGNLQWTEARANLAKFTGSVGEFRAWLLSAAESLKTKIALEAIL